jgi:ABC-type uncharacterized transport system permease subunit
MKSYETLQAMARQNTVVHCKINGMGVVLGELIIFLSSFRIFLWILPGKIYFFTLSLSGNYPISRPLSGTRYHTLR